MKKLAIVTGSSRGIGYAAAKRYSEQGFQVVNLSRSDCDLPNVTNVETDFSDKNFDQSLSLKLKTILEGMERIVLVHNAAIAATNSVADIDTEEFRRMLEINVVAPTVLNKLVLPYMLPGSAIVYVGSTRGTRAVAGSYGYVTTKHTSIGMMRATCQDLMGTGIHTACICPGYTNTEMLQAYIEGDPARKRAMESLTSQDRLIEPSEIADLLYFAGTNPVVNGEVIVANLGEKENTLIFDQIDN